MGGTLGLFGGLSFLTFLQFFEVFIYMLGCFRTCEPKFVDENDEKQVAPEAQQRNMSKSKEPGMNSLYGSAKSHSIYNTPPHVVED
jgi:hypothetical protein